MKAELIEPEKKVEFKPIEIKITLEDLEETIELWHRLNVSIDSISAQANKVNTNLRAPTRYDSRHVLWEVIDEHLKALGVRR